MDTKSLALISGKGGSGKTTMAICMASMLAESGQKVLLVDCDLSTNGATFFFEDLLNEHKDRIFSFTDIIGLISGEEKVGRGDAIRRLGRNEAEYLYVAENFAFVPSIMPSDLRTNLFDSINIKRYSTEFPNIYSYLKIPFDIVLFDCQAGYSEALEYVLPVSDYTLLIMEADAISSAAARNLYIKTEKLMINKKTYQIFSKVTEEEKAVYGQVLLGTFYTNIGAVIFDWNVRKAFGLAKIPDVKSSKSEFGMQVYDICTNIFSSEVIKDSLQRYKIIFEYNALQGEVEKIRPDSSTKYNLLSSIAFALGIEAFITAVLVVFKDYINSDLFRYTERPILLLLGIGAAIMAGLLLALVMIFDGKRTKQRNEYLRLKKRLNNLVEKYPELIDYSRR